jgi:hypothetical protein
MGLSKNKWAMEAALAFRGALLLVLFRLWFFLLAIASQLALCHLALPSLAVDAAF